MLKNCSEYNYIESVSKFESLKSKVALAFEENFVLSFSEYVERVRNGYFTEDDERVAIIYTDEKYAGDNHKIYSIIKESVVEKDDAYIISTYDLWFKGINIMLCFEYGGDYGPEPYGLIISNKNNPDNSFCICYQDEIWIYED